MLIGPVGKAPTDLRCYDLCPFLGPLAKSKLWPDQADPAQRVEAVSKLIQTQIDPASWRESGGTVGAAHEYGGLLLVRHSLSVQEEIAGLLRTLP